MPLHWKLFSSKFQTVPIVLETCNTNPCALHFVAIKLRCVACNNEQYNLSSTSPDAAVIKIEGLEMEMQAERGNNYKEKDQEGRCKQEEA